QRRRQAGQARHARNHRTRRPAFRSCATVGRRGVAAAFGGAVMEIDVLTLFPRIFEGPLDESILKRAQKSRLVAVRVHNLRDFTHDKHRVVDDKPYGGGPGMLMKPEPIFEAVETIRRDESCVVLMTPQGAPLTQA